VEKRLDKAYRPVENISADEQIGMVKEIFATITGRYDFLNRFFSLRRDMAWRRFAVRKMRLGETSRFLDVATGTADLAIETVRRHEGVQAAGLDFVREMMEAGRPKIVKNSMEQRIRLLQGDALQLPFSSHCFDVAAIAFGIRNIPDKLGALREMTRVTTPGGQVMVLEMNFPQNRLFRRFYDLYLSRALPFMAQRLSRNPAAYHYLADSIVHFPSPKEFSRLMETAGLTAIEAFPLTLGITYCYIGKKPAHSSILTLSSEIHIGDA
jgi:demethylmenaquinone methyltransferase / 2-methoxy-6-polyprenyl-1,4-benzoquinol methylase